LALVGDGEVEVVVAVEAANRGRPVGDAEVDADTYFLEALA